MRRTELRGLFDGTDLSAAARFVFVMLDAHADGAGRAWPSVGTLADVTGFGTTTVRAALRELEAAGWIVGKARTGQPTMYEPQRLALPHPNGIRPLPQRNSPRTPTPGVAKGIEGIEGATTPSRRRAKAATTSWQNGRDPGFPDESLPTTVGDICSVCHGTGWVYVDDDTVTPCECRKAVR